jgi:hypothetical protein
MRLKFSLFRLIRALLFLSLPLPLARWCWDERYMPLLQRQFIRATSTPKVPWHVGSQIGWQLERDLQFINIQFWISKNKPVSRRSAGMVAQSLGIVGAAACFVVPKRRRTGACTECGYSLDGLSKTGRATRCPECGHAEDASNVLHASTPVP